jgi:septum formation protein
MTFQFISYENPLMLASASPRRKELLAQVRIPFISVPGDVYEDGEKGRPCEICTGLAEKKALSAYKSSNKNWILGADTIVVKDGIIMGKPSDAGEAACMLDSLSDGDHEVITGFSIIDPSGHVAETSCVSTTVKFKALIREEIDAYIKTGEPFGKAGAYAIQGIGAFMIKSISGSYSNVVGLPLFAVIDSLKKLEAIDSFPIVSYA